MQSNLKLILLSGTFLLGSFLSFAQKLEIERIDPPNWWAGMKETELQLLVHGSGMGKTEVSINYPGVQLKETTTLESPNYIFLTLDISQTAKPGSFQITFIQGKNSIVYDYKLKERAFGPEHHKGLNAGDVIYFLMPDRFANGDPGNDNAVGMTEQFNRQNPGGKHGGDLQGIIDHLDYIQDLGATAIWLTPVFENNMPSYSYHGYSITDHYRVDPRYGSNDLYKEFVKEAQDRDLKVIKDMVFNHCGSEHWWIADLPSRDWLNQWPVYTQTNYANSVASDPNASDYDFERHVNGWFVQSMPDLNQKNRHLATYLFQSSIWWIESFGINGIRMDTYPYVDKQTMVRWVKMVLREYPDFFIVGETWLHGSSFESYWQGDALNGDGFNSFLPSISDFPVHYATINAFKEGGSVNNLYDVISKDFLFRKPSMNKIFIDNHDMDRGYAQLGKNLDKLKLATTFILTTRGIPQYFYGTEILMSGTGDHGLIREDFPGGWQGDSRDAFSESGRTDEENEYFGFVKSILNWRKTSEAVAYGELTHFIPEDELYVYSKSTDKDAFVVLINNLGMEQVVDINRYAELFTGFSGAKEVISDRTISDLNNLTIGPMTSMILDLNK